MSQIRIAKAIDLGAFPGSTFVVDDTPPIAQCQETQIAFLTATAVQGQYTLTQAGTWAAIDLAGKKVTITFPAPDVGIYNVISNTDDVLLTDHAFVEFGPNFDGFVHDADKAYLTRNQSSFTRFIENQGKAHTTKGGQLYTDITDPPMDDACSDTFAPQ